MVRNFWGFSWIHWFCNVTDGLPKKWIFLAWKVITNISDASKNILDLFFQVGRCFYINASSPYDVYKSIYEAHPSAYKINEFKRIVTNFWLSANFFAWKIGFSLYDKWSGTVLMRSKTLQTCFVKSGDGFRYPQSHHTSFRNECTIRLKKV